MNIWYLNHYATPPTYGVPGRPYHLAINLRKYGHRVTNICAENHHLRKAPAPITDLDACRDYGGVSYYHVHTRPYRGNGLARLLNMRDYAQSVVKLEQKVVDGVVPRPEIMIPSCVHPLAFPAASKLAKKFGAKLIYEVRDIWPLSLVDVSDISKWHPFILWLGRIERQAYRKADAVVSLLPKALEHMQPLGLDPKRFHFIPNGVSLQEWEAPPEPLPAEHQDVFRRLKDRNKMIVVYTGAHGPPNALDQVFYLAKVNRNSDVPYHFVFIGDGVKKQQHIARVKEKQINFVTFLPRISKMQVITALQKANVCFMSLRKNQIFKYGISPNKLGDYFMSRRPVLHAVSAGNDPVRDAGAGITVEPYNCRQLEEALRDFCTMPATKRFAMGENGYQYALQKLDWAKLGKRYAEICDKIAGE